MVSAFAPAADLLDPPPNPCADDPAGWISVRLDEWIWGKQDDIVTALVDRPKVGARACTASGSRSSPPG